MTLFSTTRRAVLAGLVLSTAVFAAPAFAEKAKIGCPVSKALASVETVTLKVAKA